MDEIWERAVDTALDGQSDHAAVRNLTLDGAVKCVHGRLPHPSVFERFHNLQHLSLANIGVSNLEQFPRLVNLQKLVLSDNRIAGGLECLVEAGLRSLVDLDLSNNRIQYIEDLLPLAALRLVSLDLYECPVTRVKDYRARVFGLIKSLKYLDKMDAEDNETPESDEEDEDEEEEEDGDEEEDDPGSGEVDGGERPSITENGNGSIVADGIMDGDEDEESDPDEEENEIVANGQYAHHESNGFRLVRAEEVGDDEEIEDDNSSGEEIDEVDAEDDEVVEVHEVADSDDEDDGVEYEDEEEEDGDEEDDEEQVDNKERGVRLASSTGRFVSTEGEIDGHEQGEEDDDDDNGETGEEDEHSLEEEGGYEEEDPEEEDADDDEENGSGYLVQPVNQHAIADVEDDEHSDMDPVDEEEDNEDIYDEEDIDDDLDNSHQVELPPSSSSLHSKRKRSDGDEDDMVHHVKVPKNDP